MSHYGVLGDFRLHESGEDIRGRALYGRDDEKLGEIEDVIFDHSTGDIRYVVVDTGGWLKTKNFIVPAERVRASAEHEHDFASDLTKEQVENFPPYKENDVSSEEKWADYERRYRAKWETGPVMHRAETDRNVTPTTQQLLGNRSSIEAQEATHETGARASAGHGAPKGADTAATGIGSPWDTFQARLWEQRDKVIAECVVCSGRPAARARKEGLKKTG
jgi:PRC-barrel domain protein